MVRNDSLKDRVLGIVSDDEITTKQVVTRLNQKYQTEYHYNTIKTILVRLENEGILVSNVIEGDGRKIKRFHIPTYVEKREVLNTVRGLLLKYGNAGVRHLGDVFEMDLTDDEIEVIKKRLIAKENQDLSHDS